MCVHVCVIAQITGLILITLAFLTSLLLLLMYKAMWYDQLTCPEGFILKVDGRHTHTNTHTFTYELTHMSIVAAENRVYINTYSSMCLHIHVHTDA